MSKNIIPFILIVLGAIAVFVLSIIPRPFAFSLVLEGGIIENATAIILFAGALICLVRYLKSRKARLFWLEFGVIFIALGTRELDPHRIIEGFNFLRGDFYTDPRIHLFLRLFFAVSLLCLFGVFVHFLLTNFLLFINSFKKRQAWTFTTIGSFVAEFIASAHNKLVRFAFSSLFGATQEDLDFLVKALEEPFEFIAAFLLFLVAIQIPHEFLAMKDRPIAA